MKRLLMHVLALLMLPIANIIHFNLSAPLFPAIAILTKLNAVKINKWYFSKCESIRINDVSIWFYQIG